MTKVFGLVRIDGKPADSATVEVLNPGGDVVDQVRTEEGGFTYHLTPGEWRFRAYDDAGHRGDGQVFLEEGEPTVSVIVDMV